MSQGKKGPTQLELPFSAPVAAAPAKPAPVLRHAPAPAPRGLTLIQGGGARVHEKLDSRDAVVRVLVETGADMLLKRISVERAEEIQENVDRIMELFDQVDKSPELMPELHRKLDDLEALMSETRATRGIKRRR